MAAHRADRQHPMGSDQPGVRFGVGRRGGRLVTLKEHRGVLLGVGPRPAPPGAGARAARGLARHVAIP